jgi:hypothetical protein
MPEHELGEFSVYQFFRNGDQEEVLRYVDPSAAVDCAKALTESIGGRILGTTERVIITDGSDFTCFEWVFGKGVVFPTEEQCEEAARLKCGDPPGEAT